MEFVPDHRLDPPDPPPMRPLYYCIGCGKGIYDGDEYYEIYDNCVCEDCIRKARKTADSQLEDW